MQYDVHAIKRDSLRRLGREADVLNEDQRKLIPTYYEATGLKTKIIFCLFELKNQLMGSLDRNLKKTFLTFQRECIAHIEAKIERLNEETPASAARDQLHDIMWACQEVATHALKVWSEKQASEVAQFQAESLPAAIETLGLGKQKEELFANFQRLQVAINKEDFKAVEDLLQTIRQLAELGRG